MTSSQTYAICDGRPAPPFLRRLVPVAALLLAALAAVPCRAAPPSSGRTVRIAVARSRGCYEQGGPGVRKGAGYALVERLRPYLPFKLQLTPEAKDVAECIAKLENGEVDAIDILHYKTSLRPKFAFASYPSGFSYTVVSVPEGKGAQYCDGDYSKWNGVRVAVLGDSTVSGDFNDFSQEHGFDAKMVECGSVEEFGRLAREGLADVLVHESTLVADGLEQVARFALRPYFFATRAKDAWIVAGLNAAFDSLNAADPDWRTALVASNCPLQKVSVAVAHAHGEVGKSDAGLAAYSRSLTEHLSGILAWDVEFVDSDAVQIHDGTADADVVCGVTRESASREVRSRLTRYAAGCSPVAVLARSDDTRFIGKNPSEWPYANIGYFGLEEGRPRVFEGFAAREGVRYHLEGRAVVGEPRGGLRRGEFDLGISYARLTNAEFSVASRVGNLDFYFSARQSRRELLSSLDNALEYMRIYDPGRLDAFMARDLGYLPPPPDKTLRVGAYLKSGLCEFDDNGDLDGFCLRYLRELARSAGWYLDEIPVPIGRAMGYLECGRVDIVPGINSSPAMMKMFDFSKEDMGSICQALMVMTGGKLLLNRPDTWQGMRVAMLRGTLMPRHLSRFLESRGVEWSVLHYTNMRDAERDVRTGRIDAVYTSPVRSVRDLTPLITQASSAGRIVISKRRLGLKAKIDAAMLRLDREKPEFRQGLFETFFPNGRGKEMMTPEEIEYVRNRAGKPVRVDISPLTPILAEFDVASGCAVGFAKHVIDTMAGFTGLKFELAQPVDDKTARERLDEGRTDLRIGLGGTVLKTDNAIPLRETIGLPMARVRRVGAGSSEMGKVALFKGVDELRPFLMRLGRETVMLADRTACYSAVQDGTADYMLDSYHLAKYFIQERGLYPGLAIEPIDSRRSVLPVTVAVGAGTDALFRSTIEKAISFISTSDVDESLTTALRSVQRPVLTAGQLTLLLGLIFFVGVVAFAFMRLRYEAHMRSQRQRLVFLEKIEQQQSELSKALDAANAANRAKTVFLNSMSHDIRTPMNAILGYTAMVKESPSDPSKVMQFVSKIDIAGQHLLKLINEVLEMSRIESGKIQLSEKPMDMLERARSMITIVESMASQKGVTVEFRDGGIACSNVLADVNRIDQIVQNVLGNAIKYTPPGGWVVYTIEEKPCEKEGYGLYVLTVEDNGIGMSEEFLEHVFDEFSREQTSTVSGIQGTGLGLSIVKRIVELMGGKIEISSRQGNGTKVVASIPLRHHERPAAEPEKASTDGAKPAATSLAGLRFLLVEDNEMNREVATWMLTEQGAKVEEAVNGRDAVEKYEKSIGEYGVAYDVILMDVQMPVMDGYEATKTIRGIESRERARDGSVLRRIPIIALSANAFEEDRRRSFEVGMDAHVAKPIKLNILLATVSKVVSS